MSCPVPADSEDAAHREALGGDGGVRTCGDADVPGLDVDAEGARFGVDPETEVHGGTGARLATGDEVQVGVGDFGGVDLGGEVHGGRFPSYPK